MWLCSIAGEINESGSFRKDEVKAEWLHPTETPSMKGKDVVALTWRRVIQS